MHSLRAPNDTQEWKWAWRIMGWQSNGLSIKNTQKNPQKTTPLQEDSVSMRLNRLNHLRSTLPLFPLFPLLLCVLQSSGITESTFPALLSGAIAYFLYLDKVKRRSGVLAGSDSWCCFYGGRLTVNWIVPRVQSSALSTESFPSLHIPRVLTTSSHSSLQY